MPLRRTLKKAIHYRENQYEPFNFVELSSQALLHNLKLVASQNLGHSIIPVLKANAYGHGIREIAQILNRTTLDLIAVDGYFEANAIRDITNHRILVMGAIRPTNLRLLDNKRCSYVIQDIKTLETLGKSKRHFRIHMELNTGMQRLGLTEDEIDPYLKVLSFYPNLELEGIMSHLADADNDNNTFTKKQQNNFDNSVTYTIAKGFKPRFIHLAQTAGSTKVMSKHTNALRLGIGLYGINPLSPSDPHYKDFTDLHPVMQLKSTVIKVQNLKKGDRVSYNGIFTARKAMRIGILPLGYYEGYPRALSNVGTVTYQNKTLPVVGRVCMNHTMIDLTNTDIDIGSEIVLISNDPTKPNSIQRLREDHDLFAYTLATGTNEHIRRIIT